MKPILDKIPDGVLVFLCFLSFYFLTFGRSQEYSYADGSLMFNVTKSIVEDGSFKTRVPGYYRGEVFITSSKYGLGFSIFTVPFYIAAKIFALSADPFALETITRFAPMLANVVITATTCAVLFSFSCVLFQKKYYALIITILYGVATIAWPYSRYDFAEPLTGLCILISIYTLVLFQQSRKSSWLWISSIALSYAMFTRVVEATVILIWLSYVFWLFKKEKIRAKFNVIMGIAVTIFITLILFFWYNYYRYGNILITGYEEDIYHSRMFFKSLFTGIYGLLLSPGKGLLWYSAPVIMSGFAFPIFWKQNRPLCWTFLSIIFMHLLIYSGWVAWEGGWCWGPRNLVPILPLLIISIGYWLQKNQGRILSASLFLIGFMVQFLGIVFPFNYYLHARLGNDVPVSALLFTWSDSPILGQGNLVLTFPLRLWDFALIPLLSSSHKYATMIIATILLILFGINGTILLRRIGIAKANKNER
jgi:hypothetical protein